MLDLVIIISNIYLFVKMLVVDENGDHEQKRLSQAVLIVCLFTKSLYFMKLDSQIAPLINIISKVTWDIRFFMLIFFVIEIAFMLAYYCIGKNQQESAIYNEDTESIPEYATLIGAFNHVYVSTLAAIKTNNYYDNDMTPYIMVLFFGLSFFVRVLLLKILIALMGSSFNNNYKFRDSNAKIS